MSDVTGKDERRLAAGDARVDLADDRLIRGHAIVFNKLSVDLGGFREIMAPDSVDRTLTEHLDVRALVDHDTSKILGRTTAGTLALKKDRQGLKIEIDPPNTSVARDIIESVARRDVTGMSFMFRVMPNGDDWDIDEDGMVIRTVHDMQVFEVSIVTFPAYPDTTVNMANRAMDVRVAQRAYREFRATVPSRNIEFLRKYHRTRMAR